MKEGLGQCPLGGADGEGQDFGCFTLDGARRDRTTELHMGKRRGMARDPDIHLNHIIIMSFGFWFWDVFVCLFLDYTQ